MADNLITLDTADDLTYLAEIAQANIIPALYAVNNVGDMLRYRSIAGFPSKSADFPKPPRLAAQSAAVGVELPNSPFSTTKATISAGRVGIAIEVDDLLNMSDIVNLEFYAAELGKAVAEKFTTDVCALAAGFSTQKGPGTGNNLVELNLQDAGTALRALKVSGALRGVLHNQQFNDLGASVGSTLTPAANQGTGFQEVTNTLAGANEDDFVMYGITWHVNPQVPTANSGDDRLGMVVSPPRALGHVDKRGVAVAMQRNIRKGTTEVVVDTYYGIGEIDDLSGVGILSDA